MGVILTDVKLPDKKFGKPLALTDFKGRINPDFHRPEFMGIMDKFGLLLEENSHPVIFSGRNRIIVAPFPFSDEKIVKIAIKEFFTRGLKRIKTIILPSKAQMAWRGGISLMELGIPTPLPVGYLESYRSPFIKKCCYLSVFEDGVEEIRHLFRRLPPNELRSLVLMLARHLNLCHQKGILHRDLSDGNILVKKGKNGEAVFFMIDTNRVRIRKRLGRWQKIKTLVRLGIPRQYQRYFLESYTGPGGLKKGSWILYRLRKKTYMWHINFKKRIFSRKKIKTKDSA